MSIECPKCFGSGGGPDPATSCNVCKGTGQLSLEAFMAMPFRSPEPDDSDLPELTEEDRAALEKIDIEAIIAKANQGRS